MPIKRSPSKASHRQKPRATAAQRHPLQKFQSMAVELQSTSLMVALSFTTLTTSTLGFTPIAAPLRRLRREAVDFGPSKSFHRRSRFAAHLLGGEPVGQDTVLCPGPGHGRQDRSLSVKFDSEALEGFLTLSFAADDWRVCREHVRQRLHLGVFEVSSNSNGSFSTVARTAASARDVATAKRLDLAAALWAEGKRIGETPAESYLKGRGILVPDCAYSGEALRFHQACPFKLESGETVRLPAMLGQMVDILTNEFRGVHRTALQLDGSGKARIRGLSNAKKMLGSSRNACVKLCPDDDVTEGPRHRRGHRNRIGGYWEFWVSARLGDALCIRDGGLPGLVRRRMSDGLRRQRSSEASWQSVQAGRHSCTRRARSAGLRQTANAVLPDPR